MRGLRVIPRDMGGEAAHREHAREAAVDEERARLLKQLNEALSADGGDVGKPRRLQFVTALLREHGKTPVTEDLSRRVQDGTRPAAPSHYSRAGLFLGKCGVIQKRFFPEAFC